MSRILLLGGASEIGLAIVAELLARRGPAEVILAGRPGSANREAALRTAAQAGATEVSWLDFDAADPAGHAELIAGVFASRVDIAIVAFGLLGDAETWRDHDATLRLAQTNFTGALSVGVLLGQRFEAQGGGEIVALSSVAGERVRQANLVYGATKAGFDGFYTQLGVVLAPAGVRVLVVRPGAVRGRMTGGRQVALSVRPEQVGRATVRALAAGRSMVRVPAIFTPIQAIFRNLPAGLVNRLPW